MKRIILLGLGFIFLLSCDNNSIDPLRSPQSEFLVDNQILLEKARRNLYLNNLKAADSLIKMVDTIELNHSQFHNYKLSKGFLQYKRGEHDAAMQNIQIAAVYFNDKGSKHNIAELNLIWGIILEQAQVPSEAADSYYKSYAFLNAFPSSIQYYINLLGLARTNLDKEEYLKRAEEFVENHPSSYNKHLLNSVKAYCSTNPSVRQNYYLKNFHSLDVHEDVLNSVRTISNLARNSQILGYNDSANYYLQKVESLIDKHKIHTSNLLYFYLTKAYIDNSSGSYNEARKAIDTVFHYGKDKPGLLKEAYLRKYYVEKSLGNYKNASEALLQQVFHSREANNLSQKNQLVLLTIRHEIQEKNNSIIKVRNFWLKVVIISILFMIGLTILVFEYRKKAKKQNIRANRYESQLSLTTERLKEQILRHKDQIEHRPDHLRNISYKQSGTAWMNFIDLFEITHPFFANKLKKAHPVLSNSDLKYCACFVMDKSNSQAANILDVTPGAVKKAKQKLKSIFNLDSTQDISTYLKSINNKVQVN